MILFEKNITKTTAVFTFFVGGMALVGWFFDIPAFRTVLPSMIPMKFNTTLCFFLLGISLFFHTNDKFKIATNIAFALVSLIGMLTFSQYIHGIDLKIDEFFWKDVENAIATSSPGRMSPTTAFCFTMIGSSLLLIRNNKWHLYVQIALFLAFLGAFVGLFNYIFGYGFYSPNLIFTRIALITALTVIILTVGIFHSPYLDYIKYSFEQKLIIGFVAIMIALFFVFYVFDKSKADFIDTRKWIFHTEEVINQSHEMLSKIKDVELGKRGYVITGNFLFLEPFSKSEQQILGHLERLKLLTKDNHSQQLRMNTLDRLINKELAFFKKAVELRSNKGFEDAKSLIATARGKILLDSIKNTVLDVQHEEKALLNKRKQENQKSIDSSNFMISFFQITIIVFLIILFFIAVKTFKSRQKAQELLHKSNERFFKIFNYSPVAMAITSVSDGSFRYANDTFCQSTGYERENIIGRKSIDVNIISKKERDKSVENIKINGGKIKDVELKITKANGELIDILFSAETLEIDNEQCFVYACVDISERKKAEEKLKEVNKELDSFTYSVSHDLRAPLRAITGYTKILDEDYGTVIDAEGRRVMNVISNNARKMGQLIDDLLAFSRLGRQNVVKVSIDMNNLVKSIKEDLMDFSNSKNIQIDIQNLINATADSSMIKVVMTNLLSNAVKYSSKKEKTIIEIGSYEEEGSIVYYVKDNGAGFDMLYYDKLFGVFQRLHSMSEFEGTGVGLAIVQRIIKKHGGKVWAESKTDIGSTFYFSLSKV